VNLTRADLSGALRRLRRRADLSQRQLAERGAVPRATLAGIESGASANPRFRTVERLVAAAGARLAIVDIDGSEPVCLTTDDWCDEGGRRFPPHLDVRRRTWSGIRPVEGFQFIRNRCRRDYARRHDAGELREEATFDVRRLRPGDAPALASIRASAGRLDGRRDAAGNPVAAPAPAADPETESLRYLRDPSLRHWAAVERTTGRVFGHVAARLHRRPGACPRMIVVEVGIAPDHIGGPVPSMLRAAVWDEATRLGIDQPVAVVDDPSAVRVVRALGFRRHRRRTPAVVITG
jgi:transcriptional regulator with XRE-family HTH domain